MTTETILTSEQVHELCWKTDSAEELARRVEQAVLQSPEICGLTQALEAIATYPAKGDQAAGKNQMRAIARHALQAMEQQT